MSDSSSPQGGSRPDISDSEGSLRIGVDIGGTFTDLYLVDELTGTAVIQKVLTTADDPARAVEDVVRSALAAGSWEPRHVHQIIHGTTLVTNTMIERKGAETALMATAGFSDALEIRREDRYDLYDLMLELPVPLVPRYLRFGIPERTAADGRVVEAVDQGYVEQLTRELVAYGVRSVAICFLHSFTNPAAEQAARDAVHRVAPEAYVSISSEVVPEIREYERTSTTAANAYVQPVVQDYLRTLSDKLHEHGIEGPLLVMMSSGGTCTIETAVRFPVRLLESGPAGGALATAEFASRTGATDVLSFDMGGTTAKLCVIEHGVPLVAQQLEVDRVYRFKRGSGIPVSSPVIDLIEIGAGGGSIARVDSLDLLKVGPDSAGSDPGPACYGLGGDEPTVTDADLLLGYLNPEYFLGGKMRLSVAAAREAVERRICGPLGLTVEEAAWGIHSVVNENMANAARVHTAERGKDQRRLPLFTFGGAGPVHGYRVAQLLSAPTMISPYAAGVASAMGFLTAPLAFDFVRSYYGTLDAMDWDHVNQLVKEMESEGTRILLAAGVDESSITHTRTADMRYTGQGHEVRVPLGDGWLGEPDAGRLREVFEDVYRRLNQRVGPPVPVEVLTWRVSSAGPKPDLRSLGVAGEHAPGAGQARVGSRPVYFPEHGGYAPTPVYRRSALDAGATLSGPAIVEAAESTVVVPPGGQARVDSDRSLVVTVAADRKAGA